MKHLTSEYGCIRFASSPLSAIATEAGQAGCMGIDGEILEAASEAAQATTKRYLEVAAANNAGLLSPEAYVLAFPLMQQALLHALYISAGRQVFEFTIPMIEEFVRTDLAEAPVGRLALPYPAGFLHFGRQGSLAINDHWRNNAEFVDGAYYHCGPNGDVTIQLTLSRGDNSWSKIQGPFFTITQAMLQLPASKTIDKVLDEANDQMLQLGGAAEEDALAAVRVAVREWDAANRPVLHAALALVLNSLFYLDAYGGDSELCLPDHAPQRLQEQLQRAKKSGKAKLLRDAKNAALRDGFTVVRLCGFPAIADTGETISAGNPDRTLRTHWRRGHWRMQPYGPLLVHTKRVWVRPTLVGKNHGIAMAGHNYIAGQK